VGQHPAGSRVVQLLDFLLDVFQGRQAILVLAQQDDALHVVVLVVADVGEGEGRARRPLAVGFPIADAAETRLVADDYSPIDDLTGSNPAAFDNVFDPDGLIIYRGDDQAADVADAPLFLRAELRSSGGRIRQTQHLVHRIHPAAEEADAAHRVVHLSLAHLI